jgi:hypothetical protein
VVFIHREIIEINELFSDLNALAIYVANWHKLELPQGGRPFSEENNTGVRRQFIFRKYSCSKERRRILSIKKKMKPEYKTQRGEWIGK